MPASQVTAREIMDQLMRFWFISHMSTYHTYEYIQAHWQEEARKPGFQNHARNPDFVVASVQSDQRSCYSLSEK